MAKYRRLSAEEQVKMETLAGEGHSGKSIARILGRSQSTISRELGRNREGDQPYGATRAEALATGRRRAAAKRPRKLGAADWECFEAHLKAGCRPEQIVAPE